MTLVLHFCVFCLLVVLIKLSVLASDEAYSWKGDYLHKAQLAYDFSFIVLFHCFILRLLLSQCRTAVRTLL